MKIKKARPLPAFRRFLNEITSDVEPNISGKTVKPLLPAGTEHHRHGWWETTPGKVKKGVGDQAQGIDRRRKVHLPWGGCALTLGPGCRLKRNRSLRGRGVGLRIYHVKQYVCFWVVRVKLLDRVFSQYRTAFQAEGVPLAIRLIAVVYALLETTRVTFGALNTSNQGRHIKIILFFSIRPYLIRC